jgi:hypothetical protein
MMMMMMMMDVNKMFRCFIKAMIFRQELSAETNMEA